MVGKRHPEEAKAVNVYDCASSLVPGHEKFLHTYIIQKCHGDKSFLHHRRSTQWPRISAQDDALLHDEADRRDVCTPQVVMARGLILKQVYTGGG
jgi:hypothetical protein